MTIEEKMDVINKYDGLIKKYVYSYRYKIKALNDVDLEDIESEVKLELLERINIDNSKNIPSYMKTAIHHACIKYFTSRERSKRNQDFGCESLDKQVSNDDSADILINLLPSSYILEDEACENILIEKIFTYVKNNTSHNTYVIFVMWYKGYSFQDIANIMGVSKQNVNQAFCGAVKKIRKKFTLSVDLI